MCAKRRGKQGPGDFLFHAVAAQERYVGHGGVSGRLSGRIGHVVPVGECGAGRGASGIPDPDVHDPGLAVRPRAGRVGAVHRAEADGVRARVDREYGGGGQEQGDGGAEEHASRSLPVSAKRYQAVYRRRRPRRIARPVPRSPAVASAAACADRTWAGSETWQ